MGGLSKLSVVVAGHATSISLEPEFMATLRALAAKRGLSLNKLVSQIDAQREGNLSSTIRLTVLRAYQSGELP